MHARALNLAQVEKGLLGRKSGKGFYLYPKGKKGGKGGKELNPEAVSLIKEHQKPDGSGESLAKDVIQDRMMCRYAYTPIHLSRCLCRRGVVWPRIDVVERSCQATGRGNQSLRCATVERPFSEPRTVPHARGPK